MKKVSRFAAQPKGTYGNVAPPSFHGQSNAPIFAAAPVSAAPSRPVRDYFDDDDEEPLTGLQSSSVGADQDDDYDPLDDFMSGIQEQVKQQATAPAKLTAHLPEIVSGQFDDDFEFEPSVAKATATNSTGASKGGITAEDLDELDGYLNGTAGAAADSKTRIEPLPAVDHSTINYAPFKKNFYTQGAELSALTPAEVAAMRDELDLHVTPHSAPCPLASFRQANFDTKLLNEILAVGYEAPTAIQAQAIPVAMMGYDLIGLAKTGSGKTLAYLWPMIVHILAQPQMQLGDGPIGLVLAPTRELAAQIHVEAKKFATKVYNIRAVAVYGGGGKWEMSKALKEECPEIVIATPGRFIEMVRNKSTNLLRVTMVVLDEADRMFELGFEYQMLSILNNIRRDRQVLMFSATMKRKIESFAREIIKNEVKIVVGNPGMSNNDIVQSVQICQTYHDKVAWLKSNIDIFAAEGKVLIFVLSKVGTEEVCAELQNYFKLRHFDINVACIHGDKDQSERTSIIHQYSKKHISDDTTTTHTNANSSNATANGSTNNITILIATDIASRGLDIKNIRTVINFDVAKNIETYVHRIGRTGRMGVEGVTPGTAYTLLTPKDSSFACDLVQNLNISNQPVSQELLALAQADPKWSKIRHVSAGGGYGGNSTAGSSSHNSKGKWSNSNNNSNVNRGGLGFGESGVSQGRSSVAVTSSMLAGGITKTPLPPDSQPSGANDRPAMSSASISTLPAGMRGFQRAQHDYSSVSTGPTTERNHTDAAATYTYSTHVPPVANTHAVPSASNNDFAANPYLAGHSQGRGKHLTQPSWMSDSSSLGTSANTANSSSSVLDSTCNGNINHTPTTSGQFADTTVKRKSRFDSGADSNTAVASVPPPSVIGTVSSMLPGFVRPAGTAPVQLGTYSTISTAVCSSNSSATNNSISNDSAAAVPAVHHAEGPRPAKKSRWDA